MSDVSRASLASLGRAIESLEVLLLRGRFQSDARRNAWSAVCADRARAQDRREAERVLASLGASAPGAAAAVAAGGAAPSGGGRAEPRT